MLLTPLLVAAVAFTTAVHAKGFGLVGLGRDLFEPKCCYSCLSSFWGLDLSCTDISPTNTSLLRRSGGEEENITSPHCHSTNTVYLTSLAYCIQTKCTKESVSSGTAQRCWNDVAGDGLNVSALSTYLPTTTPTTQLPYNATTLQDVSLVSEQYYNDTRQTIKSYVKQESIHSVYGTILVGAVIAFSILLRPLQMLANVLLKAAPTRVVVNFFRRHLTESALIGSLHLRKFPFRLGYIPSRITTLLIIAYIGLNVALSILTYPDEKVDTWFVDLSMRDDSILSNRIGVLCFANISLLLLFAGRNSPILSITKAGRTDIITFHRWIGRIATIEAVIHVYLYSGSTDETGHGMFAKASGLRVIGYNSSYWEMGEIAVGAMAIIFISSNLAIRTWIYEIFLFVHIALSGVALWALWNHITYRYTGANYGFEFWLYIFFAAWGYDRILRVFRVLVCNWKSLFVRSHPSSIVELLPGDEFIQVTIFPSHPWNFSANQHCFLYFPTLFTNPFQSHPFTIGGWSNGQARPSSKTSGGFMNLSSGEGGESTEMDTIPIVSSKNGPINDVNSLRQHPSCRPYITFLIRPEKGVTAHLHKRLLRNASNPSKSGSKVPVFMEGPYGPGAHSEFKNADTVIGMAGGIGITSITAHLQHYLSLQQENKGTLPRFLMVWKVREESMVSAVKNMIGDTDSLARHGVEVMILRKSDDGSRVDLGDLIKNEISGAHNVGKKVCVVTCAPGAMADVIRSNVVDCIGMKGPAGVELVEEAFAW